MEKLTNQEIQNLQNLYLGKKIEVIDEKGNRHVGKCGFIGYNPYFPSYGFQVTLSRTPVTNVDYKTIKLCK